MSQLDSMSFCIFCESYSKNRPVEDLAGKNRSKEEFSK